MSTLQNKTTNEVQEVVGAIFMDNTMAKDALNQKNYRAVMLVLERQENELKKLTELLNK